MAETPEVDEIEETPEHSWIDNLSERGTWIRLLLMILFAVIYEVAEWVVFLVAFVQFLFKLVAGKPNQRLQDFGQGLAAYAAEIVSFLTFRTETKPYPWTSWPGNKGRKKVAAPARRRSAARKAPAKRGARKETASGAE